MDGKDSENIIDIAQLICNKMKESGIGKLYSLSDFLDIAGEKMLTKAFSLLLRKKLVINVSAKLYLYPERNDKGMSLPTTKALVELVSEKYGINIFRYRRQFAKRLPKEPDCSYSYITDGQTIALNFRGKVIKIKHTTLNFGSFRSNKVLGVVLSLKDRGKTAIDDDTLVKAVEQIKTVKSEDIRHDMLLSPQWIACKLNTELTIRGMYNSDFETEHPLDKMDYDETSWCYIHVHHKQVDVIERELYYDTKAPKCFVHRTVVYKSKKDKEAIQTVNGIIFLRGSVIQLQKYLAARFPNALIGDSLNLVNDIATKSPAVIPNSQMIPFMQVVEYDASLIRIMDHPISYYADGHKLVCMKTGIMKGHEGYIVRKAGDRKFFMPFGKKSIAISGIHNEQFEVIKG